MMAMMMEVQCDAMPGQLRAWETVRVGPAVATPQLLDLGDGEFATVRSRAGGGWEVIDVIVFDDSIPVELHPCLIQRKPRPAELFHVARCLGVHHGAVSVDRGLSS